MKPHQYIHYPLIGAVLALFFLIFPNAALSATENLLLNPGFESGATGASNWFQFSSDLYPVITKSIPGKGHNGSDGFVIFGADNDIAAVIYQDVSLPAATTSATLDLYYQVQTKETTTSDIRDALMVFVYDPPTNPSASITGVASNLDYTVGFNDWNLTASNVWRHFSGLDLSAYKGKTIRIAITAMTDSSGPTMFLVDDISLTVSVSTETACTLSANPASITVGASSILTASCTPAASSYTWTGGTCAGTSGATCTVTPAATTTYTVTGANAGGTRDAASATVTVNACAYALGADSVSLGVAASTGSVNVTSACAWTATSNANWITINSGASGSGNGTVVYTVAANTGAAARTGTLTITGKTFTVVQAGAPADACSTPPATDVAGLTLTGTDSNERFTNSNGNDTMDGAGGTDTVVYHCKHANFSITATTTGWVVSSVAEGFDKLSNIERLQFADKTLALDLGGNAGQAYRIYQAAFDRTPDAGGLKYWIEQMDKGMDLLEVAARFVDSNEFRSLYGTNPANASFLTKLYNNVLHRQPEQGGYDWWLGELNSGRRTQTKALADFSESDENKAGVLPSIQNGIELPN